MYSDYNDYDLLDKVCENEESYEILMKKYQPFIHSFSLKMFKGCKNKGVELMDLEQEGMIGLTNAIETFKDNKETLFFTYATTCIKRRIISAALKYNRKKHIILNEALSLDTDEPLINTVVNSKDIPENIILEDEEVNELVETLSSKLTDIESQVFELRVNGFKNAEIAEILDIDKKSVNNALSRIKNKYKRIIGG